MKDIAALLQKKGYRLTNPRREILAALSGTPQSVDAILELLRKKGSSADKVTVYRTLDLFVELGVANKTQFKDKVSVYELSHKHDHHHHLVCDNCGSVQDIAFDESELLKKVKRHSNFKVISHTLEFFGLCVNCK